MSLKPVLLAGLALTLVIPRAQAQFAQQGGKLVGAGAVGAASQGVSAALSADGNTAIVGGIDDNGSIGALWVYTRTGGVWSQQGPKLVGTGSVGSPVYQGWSVALSADGNTAIEGGFYDNNWVGAAWVFTRTGGVWSQQGPKLIGAGAAGPARQGSAVALSADGNTALVGGFQRGPRQAQPVDVLFQYVPGKHRLQLGIGLGEVGNFGFQSGKQI